MRRALVVLALVLAALCALPPAAHAQDSAIEQQQQLPRRKAKIVNYKGWAAMTVPYRDVVDDEIREKLESGLPTTIVTRAYVFPENEDKPVALSAKTCRVVYDLWDEVFRIELYQGGKRRDTIAVNVEGVLRRCAELRRMPIVSLKQLSAGKSYFVAVLVEVNPLSEEMLERIKRWVSRPKGAGAVGPGDSLFGSFVGLFVTHVPEADRVLSFRGQSFVPQKLPVEQEKKKATEKKTQLPPPPSPPSQRARPAPPPPPDKPRVMPPPALPAPRGRPDIAALEPLGEDEAAVELEAAHRLPHRRAPLARR
jgi:hypothetical protein